MAHSDTLDEGEPQCPGTKPDDAASPLRPNASPLGHDLFPGAPGEALPCAEGSRRGRGLGG